MTTQRQILANRANAKLSTGSKTKEGKARSRQNAWKHGFTASKIVVADEDPLELDNLSAELYEVYQPLPGQESMLVDLLAFYGWRLLRVPGVEAAIIKNACKMAFGAFDHQTRLGDALVSGSSQAGLALLGRYEAGLMRNITRTLHLLLLLQDRRRAQEDNGTLELLPSSKE
jgi:hypothetical protein